MRQALPASRLYIVAQIASSSEDTFLLACQNELETEDFWIS